jgi:hypothetical protein
MINRRITELDCNHWIYGSKSIVGNIGYQGHPIGPDIEQPFEA